MDKKISSKIADTDDEKDDVDKFRIGDAIDYADLREYSKYEKRKTENKKRKSLAPKICCNKASILIPQSRI